MKKLIKILICFCLVYTPFFANAGAAEQWELVENTYDDVGKTMSYMAKKMNVIPSNDYTYKAKVPVTAVTLGSSAKMLIRGGLASAAIYGIVEGVGWIIDNGIVKKPVNSDEPVTYYIWKMNVSWSQGDTYCKKAVSYSTGQRAVQDFMSCALQNNYINPTCSMASVSQYSCQVTNKSNGSVLNHYRVDRFTNTNYDPSSDFVPVSDNELGNEIIKSPAAPQVIPDIYNPNQPTQTPARDASQDALDKALPVAPSKPDATQKPNKDTDGDGKPDVYDPELPSEGFDLNFEFCEIAAVMCVWYEKYSEDSKKADQQREDEKGFWQKVEDWFDWTKEEPGQDDEDTEVEVNDLEIPDIDTSILKASGQCPADFSYAFPLPLGGTHTISYSYATVCYWFSKLYYIVITVAWVVAYKIVTGIGGTKQDG